MKTLVRYAVAAALLLSMSAVSWAGTVGHLRSTPYYGHKAEFRHHHHSGGVVTTLRR